MKLKLKNNGPEQFKKFQTIGYVQSQGSFNESDSVDSIKQKSDQGVTGYSLRAMKRAAKEVSSKQSSGKKQNQN